ncbi:LORF2 protein, partial [Crocuta crocuta]
ECKIVQPFRKTVWLFLIKLNILFPYNPAITIFGIYPMSCQLIDHMIQQCLKKTCTKMFTAALFIIAKRWKQLKCPLTHEWINKMWHINTIK